MIKILLFVLTAVGVPLLVLFFYAYARMGALPGKAQVAEFEKLANFRDGRFANDEPARLAAGPREMSKVVFRLFGRSANAPDAEIPQVKLGRGSFSDKPGGDSLIWLGHSMLIFELGGTRFITDPVFGNAAPVPFAVMRYCESPLARKDLPPLDFVLVSHDHYDHLEYETVRHFKDGGARFVVPLGVGARLTGWGIAPERVTELNWGDSAQVGGVRITAAKARHFSGRSPFDRDKTLWASYIIESGGKKVFFGADSGYGKHFKEIGDAHGPFDLVMLEADAWNERWPNNHMFPDEAVPALKDLRGRALMPIHWGVFDLAMHPWDESARLVRENAERAGVPLFSPLMGERVPLFEGL